MSPFLWFLLRLVQFWVLDLILSSGLTVQHSLTYCLDHEQVLTTVKDRAIIFQLEKLLTMDSLRAVRHLETLLQKGWVHRNLGKDISCWCQERWRGGWSTGVGEFFEGLTSEWNGWQHFLHSARTQTHGPKANRKWRKRKHLFLNAWATHSIISATGNMPVVVS